MAAGAQTGGKTVSTFAWAGTFILWLGAVASRLEEVLTELFSPLVDFLNKTIGIEAAQPFLESVRDFFRITEAAISSSIFFVFDYIFREFHLNGNEKLYRLIFVLILTFLLMVQISAQRYKELVEKDNAASRKSMKGAFGAIGGLFAFLGLLGGPVVWVVGGTLGGILGGLWAGNKLSKAAENDSKYKINARLFVRALMLGTASAAIYMIIILSFLISLHYIEIAVKLAAHAKTS